VSRGLRLWTLSFELGMPLGQRKHATNRELETYIREKLEEKPRIELRKLAMRYGMPIEGSLQSDGDELIDYIINHGKS